MAKLLPGLRSLFRLSGGVKDRATATALRSIEDWAEQLVRRLAALEESTGSGGVPTTRTISTTAPLSGGGDLSANRTLSVSTFGAADSGVVPASGGGTSNFLRADGTWASPGAAAAVQIGLFGTGRDGVQDFDGVSAVLGVSPAADTIGDTAVSCYTMNRDWYLDDGTSIADGVAILTNGWRLFVKGELVTPLSGMAYIGNWGNNGNDGSATVTPTGGAARSNNLFHGGAAGGNGGNTSTGVGTAGTLASNTPRDFSNSGGTGANGAPGNPGVSGRGGGGGSSASGSGGSPAGTVSNASISAGDIDNLQQAMDGRFVTSTTYFGCGSGGGGGRGQTSGSTGTGGSGGASGAATFIAIERLSDESTLTLTVQGGNGGDGFGGAGGGGGGGGGWMGLAIGQTDLPVISVAGGLGGEGGPDGGFAGGDGGPGVAKVFIFA